jgi:hypothetical protein
MPKSCLVVYFAESEVFCPPAGRFDAALAGLGPRRGNAAGGLVDQ